MSATPVPRAGPAAVPPAATRAAAIGTGIAAALAAALAIVLTALVLAGGASSACAAPAAPARRVIDDFERSGAWSAHPADGVSLTLAPDAGLHGRGMRLDFDFHGGGGYAIARRAVDLDLPANYRFRFALRGECLPNNLEFKLVDSTDSNVWWSNRRDVTFPARWDSVSLKKRQIGFAWGPIGGGEIHHVAAIEIVVTAGGGGRGHLWLDDLTLETLPPEGTAPPAPIASASSSASGSGPARAFDGDSVTAWVSGSGDRAPTLTLDLGLEREFGGVVLDWERGRRPAGYVIEGSGDGRTWRALRSVGSSQRVRDYLDLPESETRHLRVRTSGGPVALSEITLEPLAWSESRAAFFEAIARDAPRGNYPRGMSGEQVYWTVVGADGAREEALLSEDGAVETGKAGWSIEPFLFADGRLITWADATAEHTLEDGDLPIPSVRWRAGALDLTVTAFVGTSPAGDALCVRYRVRHHGAGNAQPVLFLALRPFQVNPPTQFLNTPGGVAAIRTIERRGGGVRVNGERRLFSTLAPDGFGATGFDQGDITDWLKRGELPADSAVSDPFEGASAALRFRLPLSADADTEVAIMIPLRGPRVNDFNSVTSREIHAWFADAQAAWRRGVDRVGITLPDTAMDVVRTLRAQLGFILVNRDSAAIQPGSRSYDRSWIRDGALTSTALLRMGHTSEVRAFINWFAVFQYPDGKVPCCVDARGADPVPEHDSHGEFIDVIAEYLRYTGDTTTVASLWPRVLKAADYIEALRQQRRTAVWRTDANAPYFGLLPPSISHEGYSAKPMHSYWDDLFALRGLKDATFLAGVLGHPDDQARLARRRDEFEHDLSASFRAAMAAHAIDYLPGCADLGDFDATSTTIALDPVQAGDVLPPGALERTFERYWSFFRDRRDGVTPWDAYTPYEVRTIGAFVRLGWRERADSLTTWFMKDRRPAGWRQWAEVVDHDPRHARFIGDMPHTWVGSDFVRSTLDRLAYDRERDQALVIAAGVPERWTAGDGVGVRDLRTPWGMLRYTLRARGTQLVLVIDRGVRLPPGGLVLAPPLPAAWRHCTINGVSVPIAADRTVTVRQVPVEAIFSP